jgi:hypothetical protein
MKKEFIDSIRYDLSLLELRVANHLSRIDEKIEGIEASLDELSNVYKVQRQEPYVVNTNQPDWLNETIKDIDEMVLEKKIRERIIARLEEEAEDNLCSCGDICNAFDNGFNTAIQSIKDL